MEEKLINQYDTVGDLILHLKSYPEDMPVRIEGNYISRMREKGDTCHIEIMSPQEYENLSQVSTDE